MPKMIVKNEAKKDVKLEYTVKSVSISEDSSVGKYKGTKSDLDEVIKGLKAGGDWSLGFKVEGKKSPYKLTVNSFGYPDIGKHPGHVHPPAKGWKYKIEGGPNANSSVDRAVVSGTKAKVDIKSQSDTEMKVEVTISCDVKVFEDTH